MSCPFAASTEVVSNTNTVEMRARSYLPIMSRPEQATVAAIPDRNNPQGQINYYRIIAGLVSDIQCNSEPELLAAFPLHG